MNSPKLPMDEMLMISRIVNIDKTSGKYTKGQVISEYDIHPDLWFFKCHFIGDPVMPGCLGLDALWQLCGFFLAWSGMQGKGRALGVGAVKFTGQVMPETKKITYKIDVKRVIDRKLKMVIADAVVEADGTEIYYAEDLKVGIFSE